MATAPNNVVEAAAALSQACQAWLRPQATNLDGAIRYLPPQPASNEALSCQVVENPQAFFADLNTSLFLAVFIGFLLGFVAFFSAKGIAYGLNAMIARRRRALIALGGR